MSRVRTWPVALSLRIYRALARAFPYEFRNAYGDDVVLLTEEAIEPIWRRYGLLGVVRLLLDITVRVPAEYVAEIRRDVRHGLRMLAGSPGFTAVALLSLSLAIAIATCAFSEVNGLILRDLPGVRDPGQLVMLQLPTSFPYYKRYRQQTDLFSDAFAYVAPVAFGVSFGGRPERSWGHLVTPSYFTTLDVHPALGRFFDEEQAQPGRAPAVVISYRFWRDRLGSDRSVAGRTLRVNGQPCAIIGVAPEGFQGAAAGLFAADLWLPVGVGERVAPELGDNALERSGLTMFQVTGRLKPGIALDRAEAQLDAVTRKLELDYGVPVKPDKSRRILLVSGGKLLPLRKQDIPFFTEFLMLISGLVVLIACSNLANMLLARAGERRREIAVRLALGAGRARLVRQLLVENMLVALGAGALAVLLSIWLLRAASQMTMPLPMLSRFDFNPDGGVLLFTLAITVLTGLLFGIAPAWRATRCDLAPALKEGGIVQFQKRRGVNLRNLLVIFQMAGSLMLLVVTGYLGIGIQGTLSIQRGFDARNLYLIALDPVRDGFTAQQAQSFFEKLLDRVQRLPSVTSAALTDTLPVSINGNGWTPISSPGGDTAGTRALRGSRKFTVGKDYFATAGIPIVAGRAFRKDDEKDDATGAIVSRQLAREFWKGADPVGRRFEIGTGEIVPGIGVLPGTFDFRDQAARKSRQIYEVVGIAEDVPDGLVVQKPEPAVYLPLRPDDYARPSLRGVTLIVRGLPGVDVIGAVEREVSALDSRITPFNARSMTQHIEQFMSSLHGASWTYGVVGVFGLILAAVGLAGVTAYSVTLRGHEIGIRMALGAQRGNVLGLVMKEGAVLVAIGTLIGTALTWAGIRALSGIFFSVSSVKGYDPMLIVGAPLLLAGVAMLACYLPARRATRIDPILALRQE